MIFYRLITRVLLWVAEFITEMERMCQAGIINGTALTVSSNVDVSTKDQSISYVSVPCS